MYLVPLFKCNDIAFTLHLRGGVKGSIVISLYLGFPLYTLYISPWASIQYLLPLSISFRHSYNSAIFPDWLMGIAPYNFPNLVSIYLDKLDNCISLPPLGQLLSLKKLVLRQMKSLLKIEDFCGGVVAFPCLENFSLRSMPNLEVWNTTYSYRGDGVNRYMFPCLRILDIESCPKLRLEPCPPKAEVWTIL